MQFVQHARRTFTSSLLALCLLMWVWLGAVPVAHAATATIRLSPTSGLPTSSVKVKGSGFGASETVTITFDSTPVKVTTSSGTGTFSTRFQVPQAASIGTHTVTATGQNSGKTASAPFQVLPANWPLFGFDARHSRVNPYENILNTSNVSSLSKAWSFATGNTVFSSPAVVNGVVYVGSRDNNVYALNLP
jgi:PQQ-like domain